MNQLNEMYKVTTAVKNEIVQTIKDKYGCNIRIEADTEGYMIHYPDSAGKYKEATATADENFIAACNVLIEERLISKIPAFDNVDKRVKKVEDRYIRAKNQLIKLLQESVEVDAYNPDKILVNFSEVAKYLLENGIIVPDKR